MGEERDTVEFVSVGLDTLLVVVLTLLELLFLLYLNRRLNKGGRLCLDSCGGVDFELLMVRWMGGLAVFSFDIVLIADVAPMLLLLLLVTLMAAMPFLESEIVLLPVSFDEKVEERFTSTSSDSMTLSNLVFGNPEEEETLNCEENG